MDEHDSVRSNGGSQGKNRRDGQQNKRTADSGRTVNKGRTAGNGRTAGSSRTAGSGRTVSNGKTVGNRTVSNDRTAGKERTVSRNTSGSRDSKYRGTSSRRRRKSSGGAAAVVLTLLIVLVIAAIVFVIKDGFSGNSSLGGLFNKDKSVIRQAEEYAKKYDYDGALTVLQGSDRYAASTSLQEKAAEYESEQTAMNTEIEELLASAQTLADSYDYQGAADTIKASTYYDNNTSLQEKAAEYETAEANKGIVSEATIAEADNLAAMYDYDSAIALLQSAQGYQDSTEAQSKVAEYESEKASCVAIDPTEVTHIFYHSLVVDPSRAFVEGESGYAGWQQWMTTVYEFDKITQSMYDRGYVLVNLSDLYTKTVADDGTVTITANPVYLPEGKKAYVLSVDDLSYYHTYDGHGVAAKIVLDDEGKPTCEYVEADGSVVYGDYDVVPRLDTFMEEHPDGCYRGARGTIALTGYNGILGYRTDGSYSEENNTDSDIYYADELQLEWLSEHPDFDWKQECEDAKKVADALKADGWSFASHTWGHKAVGTATYDELVRDTERWFEYVSPLIGETDTIIFAHGEDISETGSYDSSNDKYNYLKSQGFDIYCNVDSTAAYTTTVTSEYFHQGRRNLDGYRIYQDMVSDVKLASDLFDAASVIDPDRPLPVPDL